MTRAQATRPPPPSSAAAAARRGLGVDASGEGAHFISEQCKWSRSPAVIQNLSPSRGNVKMEWVLGNIGEVLIS